MQLQAPAATQPELIAPPDPTPTVPFNQPHFAEPCLRHMSTALASGRHGGDGPFTHRCERFLQGTLGVSRALLTTSRAHALETAALLLDLRAGDEVIVPAYAFVATAAAFAQHGARLRFADVRPDTLNIDPAQVEARVTPRTRAIVVLHYGGIACDLERILALARHHGLPIIEDNPHGLFGQYRGHWLGSLGSLGTLSFHETKSISCGEGGALLVNEPDLIGRAEAIRAHGAHAAMFAAGHPEPSPGADAGSGGLPSDIIGAMLLGQFERAGEIHQRRQRQWDTYDSALLPWSRANGVQTPFVPSDCRPSHHLYYLLLPTPEARDALRSHLRARGIAAHPHYAPLPDSTLGQVLGSARDACPTACHASGRLLRLPLFHDLSPAAQSRVVEAVTSFTP